MAELSVAHVMHAEADKATGMITASLGDALSGEGVDSAATVFQQWGFISIPAAPIPGVSGPEAVYIETGDANIVVGGRSVRTGSIAKLIKPGESCAFADGSMARTLYKLDGSVIQFSTHDNTDNGRAVFQSVGPAGYEFSWPWGRTIIDKSGWSTIHVGGASIHCGQLGLSGPFAALSALGLDSYIALTAPLVRINGSVVSLGPDTGVPEPVVKAVQLLAVLDALYAVLTAIGGVGTEASPIVPPVPGLIGPPPVAMPIYPSPATLLLIKAAQAAILIAHTTIGSTSVTTT